VPERFIGLFVAQGLPEELTEPGLDFVGDNQVQPLRSLKPFESRMSMVRGLNVNTLGPGKTEHTRGCSSFLCGYDYQKVESKGGPTLDWIVQEELVKSSPLATLNTGIWGADDAEERTRMVHSYRGVNQPNEPIADTLKLFEYVFGDVATPVGEPGGKKLAHYRASVLDRVLVDYHHAVNAEGYGASVKQLLSHHMETVRELEIRATQVAEGLTVCEPPLTPTSVPGNGHFPPNVENWPRIWEVVADIYIQALRCGLVNTGTMMVDSGGDRWAFHGNAGTTNNVHGTTLHGWRSERNYHLALEIWQWYYDKAGDFLTRLDDASYRDADGGTLLDNTTVLVGTELGDPMHDLNHLTFMLFGAQARFRRGIHTFNDRSDVDFYNTVLQGLGINRLTGTEAYREGPLDIIA
jgi:hypothetical protein